MLKRERIFVRMSFGNYHLNMELISSACKISDLTIDLSRLSGDYMLRVFRSFLGKIASLKECTTFDGVVMTTKWGVDSVFSGPGL